MAEPNPTKKVSESQSFTILRRRRT